MVKIGFSIHSTLEARWQCDLDMVQKFAPALGIDLVVANATGGSLLQIEQCGKLIASGVQALLVAPQDSYAAAKIVEAGNAQKVPVIAYERMIMNCDLPLFAGFDARGVGKVIARYALDKVPQGDYIILDGDEKDANSHLLREGYQEILKPALQSGKIRVQWQDWTEGWRTSRARQNTLEAMKKCPRPAVIMTFADVIAEGVIQALSELKPTHPILITAQNADLNAVPRILRGIQTMSVHKSIPKLAQTALKAALALASGKPPATNGTLSNGKRSVPSIFVSEMIAVDKSNILKVLTSPDGMYTLPQVCAKLPRNLWPPEALAASQ